MEPCEIINDNRTPNYFKNTTFSNYQKKSVFSELQKAIKSSNIESSCHWLVEAHCSGYIDEIWDKLIIFGSSLVNSNVPKLPSYIFNRYQSYLEHIGGTDAKTSVLLSSRNNATIRYQLTEVICLLSTCEKKDLPKANSIKPYEVDINWIKGNKRLIDNMYMKPSFIRENDCKEIHIIIYQFIQYLTIAKKDIHNAIYWMSWLIAWENKNKNNPLAQIESRDITGLDPKYQKDIIWIIWETIITETNDRNNSSLSTQIQCLYQLYKFNFSQSKRKSRIPLIIHAISLLTLNIEWSSQLTNKQNVIKQVCVQINKLYMDLQNNFSYKGSIALNPPPEQSLIAPPPPKSTSKKNKSTISEDSINKLDAFNRISNQMLNQP